MTILPPIGIIRAGVQVNITLEVRESEQGEPVCIIHTLAGVISLPPREWLRAVREEVRKLERIARSAGCVEMRTEGRDWSTALSALGYVPWPEGEGFGLRKVL